MCTSAVLLSGENTEEQCARIARNWPLSPHFCAHSQVLPAPGLPNSGLPQNTVIPTLKFGAQIVVLDHVVTHKNGRLVQRRLSRQDFTILDNGIPQTLRSCEPPEGQRMPSSSEGHGKERSGPFQYRQRPRALNVVLVELNSRLEDMRYARQTMVKYLQSQPAILPQPTLLTVTENRSF